MEQRLKSIETYAIEDLSIAQLDDLIEKGVCFDVYSKTALLAWRKSGSDADTVRESGDF